MVEVKSPCFIKKMVVPSKIIYTIVDGESFHVSFGVVHVVNNFQQLKLLQFHDLTII